MPARAFPPRPISAGLALCTFLAACSAGPSNSPYPAAERGTNTLYGSFRERPKHLDPAQSYSSNEIIFTAQIYEPPLQYHYLRRPYQLVPLTGVDLPTVRYFAADGTELGEHEPAERVVRSVYAIRLRPGIRYQPHPAFARDEGGRLLYHEMDDTRLAGYRTIADFRGTGSRELVAADYVYQIKRLAHPDVQSPIRGLMAEYVLGLGELAARLSELRDSEPDAFIDLREHELAGVQVTGRHSYQITIHGKYPQFIYWLAMPFFAPVPWEADRFYAQPGMAQRNLTLDWFPVGTGPYMLVENNPNYRMTLRRNPNFRGEPYPDAGEPGDGESGLLADAGKRMPFIDSAVYSLEKEDIPYWSKFLQGYYDTSGVSSDSFDQAVTIGGRGEVALSEALVAQGIRLQTAIAPTIFYLGFNMLDPVVGGYSARARKLRQALAIAIDYEEFVSIFLNGRGIAAHGPLPPGIFGYRDGMDGINPFAYEWRDGRAQRHSIDHARRLLAEAGIENGRDRVSGEPLVLNLDITASGPQDKARLDWFRKQFRKLDIELLVRNTDYNRFQDKMRNGNAQIFFWGWNADYPDPENFLFLLYGPNGKVAHGGENAANYSSAEFDRLFDRMKSMANGAERQALIDAMLELVREDAPWVWGFHPTQFTLLHSWYGNAKPNQMANNTLKFHRIDPLLRERRRMAWNEPRAWPFFVVLGLLIVLAAPALVLYLRRERADAFGSRAA